VSEHADPCPSCDREPADPVVGCRQIEPELDYWKSRAEAADARLAAVEAICDERERAWSEGVRKPTVPTWITKIRAAAQGDEAAG
jgi:hypothetical protein